MSEPGSRWVKKATRFAAWLILYAWLVACAPMQQDHSAFQLSAPVITPSATSSPGANPGPLPLQPTPPTQELYLASSTLPAAARVCSPFPDASQADLLAAISNPFAPPPPGSDDPHQGIDLAVQQQGIALAGAPVWAVLSGSVAMVTADRFPYGYALLVETPLEALPPDVLVEIHLPAATPTLTPNPALNCPPMTPEPPWDLSARSLYVLYAHLEGQPAFRLDERVECGQMIGRIGQSGNALNPHLHLEARLGPAGARFVSMAHYDNAATTEEMGNYCVWRVSGVFQLLNPLDLLRQLP